MLQNSGIKRPGKLVLKIAKELIAESLDTMVFNYHHMQKVSSQSVKFKIRKTRSKKRKIQNWKITPKKCKIQNRKITPKCVVTLTA